ncbi:hypothetical protein POTOM_052039 [Populus tomentosa]|uniref:Uncharacterized protein n=1 Tax=Populus tomentosa TaxID=118781 RepID=A0A8X8CA86_POPTO|nr:hypothetical protein POTOM_052039 [Populus tomentosa]
MNNRNSMSALIKFGLKLNRNHEGKKVKSKLLSLHDRRFLKDAAGNTLVNLRQKIRTMHGRWEAFRGESKEKSDLLFTAKKSKLFQFKTELDVFLGNNKGEVPDFKVKEGYSKSSRSILLGDSNTMLAQHSGSDWDCGRWLGNQVAAAVMVVLWRFFFFIMCSSLCLSLFFASSVSHGAGAVIDDWEDGDS